MKQPLLEHNYQGESPLRTLWFLFEGDRLHLLIAALVFVVKHSPVWLMPLLTANIIDVLVQRGPLANLWWNALVMVLLFFQNIPMQMLYMHHLSVALRRMETRLRSALSRQLQRLSINFFARASAGVLQNIRVVLVQRAAGQSGVKDDSLLMWVISAETSQSRIRAAG